MLIKIIYEKRLKRKPETLEYDTEEADLFIAMCLQFGTGVLSCEKLTE